MLPYSEAGPKGSTKDNGPSIAAVVGTVDRSACQYVSYVEAQGSGLEFVDGLATVMFKLLGSFKERNGGHMPKHLLVYRDGVADSQFEGVLEKELTCIQDAILQHGAENIVKVAFVVCQKNHHTRFVCSPQSNGEDHTNLCPGIVIDSTDRSSSSNSVTSAVYNEFYLNSHTAIQGTGKAPKYSLLYDEIGMKMIELQLLTYWLSYMYCRCNKSVSMVTPVYYAHWAAKRARYQLNGGATPNEIGLISDSWAAKEFSTMNFV